MRHYKILILLALLTGCSSQVDTETLITSWVQKSDQCVADARASEFSFPSNEWFDALPLEQKRNVVVYIYQERLTNCFGPEAQSLKTALEKHDNQTLLKFFDGYGAFEEPDESRLEGVNKEKVAIFSKNIPLFNLGKVGQEIPLHD